MSLVYAYFRGLGLTIEEIDFNVLTPTNSAEVYHCRYDIASIMHYQIPNFLTLNNFSVGSNTVLSNEDKSFIEKLYPFNSTNSSCGFCVDNCADFQLTTQVTGEGTISIRPTGSSTVNCSSDCTYDYETNQVVNVQANPKTGYRFVRWEGSLCHNSTSNSCRMIMNRNHTINAIFEPISVANYVLSLNVSGQGTIQIATEANIQSCQSNCALSYPASQMVTLSAIPANGYRFVGWSGNPCNNLISSCNITMNRARTITALFEPINSFNFEVTVSPETCTSDGFIDVELIDGQSNYQIHIQGDNDIDRRYQSNTSIFRLTDLPEGNYTLTITDGRGLSKSKTFTVYKDCNSNKHLSLQVTGEGSVRVNSTIDYDPCSNSCNYIFFQDQTEVRLTATPSNGYRFVRWEGDVCNNSRSTNCYFTMTGDLSVRAIFEQIITSNFDFSMTITPATCTDGGAIDVNITNGQASYQVHTQGDNGIDERYQVGSSVFTLINVPEGNYTLTITDSRGLTKSKIFTVDKECNSDKDLNLQVIGEGSVRVHSNINISNDYAPCSNSCTYNFYHDQAEVRLIAIPSNGYRFVRWEGDVCNNSTSSDCYFIMTRDLRVRAIFEPTNNSNSQEETTSNRLQVNTNSSSDLNKEQVLQNYPNPFSSFTTLPITLSEPTIVEVEVFSGTGKRIYQESLDLAAGENKIELDGSFFPESGIYIYQIHTKNQIFSGKISKL